MNIEFPDLHAIDPDTFEISFPADAGGNRMQCLVTTEALQDINASGAMNTPETQFQENKYQIQEIAETKIRDNDIQNNKVVITSSDVI